MKEGDFYQIVAKHWVRGYVSAYNIYGPEATGNLLRATTDVQVDAHVDSYCETKPDGLIAGALLVISDDIARAAGTLTGSAEKPARRKATLMVATTCAEWTGAEDDPLTRLAYASSVRGFLTAYNLYRDPDGDVVGSGDDELVDIWIDGWCSSRPKMLLLSAAHPLTQHLAAERAAGRLPPGGKLPGDILSPAD